MRRVHATSEAERVEYILECQRSIHKKINKEIIVEETDTSTVK